MSKFDDFFKNDDSSFGIFYPRNYVLIGFGSLQSAQAMLDAIFLAGYTKDEAKLFSGEHVLERFKAIQDSQGGWARFVQTLAASLGEEAKFSDEDLALANKGGHFLAIYSPEDRETYRLKRVAKRFNPVFMRRYLAMGIERLDGNFKS